MKMRLRVVKPLEDLWQKNYNFWQVYLRINFWYNMSGYGVTCNWFYGTYVFLSILEVMASFSI